MPAGSVLVVGDSLLEVTVAPSEPMRPGADAPACISLGPGGQGANVAVRLARHGVRVRLVTALGSDAAGRLVREALAAEGVELDEVAAERTGAVVSILGSAGERTMLSQRVPFELDAATKVSRALVGARWLHVSGYLLRGAGAVEVAAGMRHAAGSARVSVGGGSVPPGPEAERFRAALVALQPDLLMTSRDEAASVIADASRDASPVEMARRLASLAPVAIVTAGEEGSAVAGNGATFAIPAIGGEQPVVDATGAGDAYAAALIATLDGSAWPPDTAALRRAAEAASRAGAAVARVWGAQGRIADER